MRFFPSSTISEKIGQYIRLGVLGYHLRLLEEKLRLALELGVSERVIEYPWVFRNLRINSGRVLDVGCVGSYLSHELIRRGYSVWGVDVRPYLDKHPKMKFCQVDVRKTHFPSGFFDAVVAVSTIEHIGMGFGGEPSDDPNGDFTCMAELNRILKKSGEILVTLPYCRSFITIGSTRFYDEDRLEKLFNGFIIQRKEYFAHKCNKKWMKTTRKTARELATVKSHAVCSPCDKQFGRGIVCLVLKKASREESNNNS